MKKVNEKFFCINCGKYVSTAQKTCRNHCPYCFVSMHVDKDTPGDRMSSCKGVMYPVDYYSGKKGEKILFRCVDCGKEHWNKVAFDDEISNIFDIIKKYGYF
ncbi:RNHCP domain-containing protein [Candidatus Absconditicoccus praedator]|uniref:RNHCP domain-containing protein n=1 Tax=Candidatus Absconditicoccus praedator TaxID=2735562 RepID=UPI001E489B1C|nr:RNHCP domain-containing protein [Candidatus Absconditicoccus praedator]UFX82668.1 RNHCP domain-containing protein [Candidatus Absconditicoccus praedator]